MDINPLSDVPVNMFSHSVSCLFILLMISFAVQNFFSLLYCHVFTYLFLVSLAWADIADKILLWAMWEILLPMFSSSIFIVWGLTFKYVTHLEFILMCDARRWSSFIFLHVSVQFSQHQLLIKLSLAHCMYLLLLSNVNWL